MAEALQETDQFAIVEIMGHIRIAGRIHEERRFGVDMLRIEVPAIGDRPSFTRFFGGSAIFSLTPCDEATATAAASEIRVSDYSSWTTVRSLPSYIEGELDIEPDDGNVLGDDEQGWPDERVRLAQTESADTDNPDMPF